jgi:hypothetical protein
MPAWPPAEFLCLFAALDARGMGKRWSPDGFCPAPRRCLGSLLSRTVGTGIPSVGHGPDQHSQERAAVGQAAPFRIGRIAAGNPPRVRPGLPANPTSGVRMQRAPVGRRHSWRREVEVSRALPLRALKRPPRCPQDASRPRIAVRQPA